MATLLNYMGTLFTSMFSVEVVRVVRAVVSSGGAVRDGVEGGWEEGEVAG